MPIASIIFTFLHTFSISWGCQASDNGHSECCEVIPSCGFKMHFSYLAKIDLFSCAFFSRMSSCCLTLQLPITRPCFNCFLMTTLRTAVIDFQTLCPWKYSMFISTAFQAVVPEKSIKTAALLGSTYLPPPLGHFSVMLYWNRSDLWFHVCFSCIGTWYTHGWTFIYSLSSSCSHLGDNSVLRELPPAT